MKREIFTLNKQKRSGGRLLLAALAFLFSFQLSAQLIGWNTAPLNVTFGPSPFAPATLNPNLTMVTGLSRGASILTGGTPATQCWGGSGGWGTTDAGSMYFVFKANAGYSVSLSSISSALRRSGSGPTSYLVAFSLNGGAYTTVGTWTNAASSGTTGQANSSALSGIAALQNIAPGTEVRFRITFPGSSGGGNFYFTGAANSLRVEGTVTPVALPCTAPAGLTASNLTATTADLDWNAVSGATGYEYVVDQTAGNPSAAGTATTETTYDATGLTASSTYYLHVRTNCGSGNYSSWTTISFGTDELPCLAPAGLTTATVTSATADLSWDEQGLSSFEYVVDEISEDPSAAGTATTETTFNATDLTPETIYYLHVRTDCGDGNFSPWTTLTFTTLVEPCIAPTGLSADNTTATTSDLSWDVQGSNSFEYVVDEISEDPSSAGTATTETTFNATDLTAETTYYLHVRTDCGDGNFSPWTTLTFTTLVEPCIAPAGLSADNTTATTSDLSWDEQGTSSFEYVVDEISEDPSSAGTATTETTFNATDLTAETIYYLHVRTDCGGGNFSPWTTLTFTTLVEPCIAPTGLSADNTTATTSDLSWDTQGSNSFEYVVDEISEDPSAAGTATTETTFNATDLTPETIYYLHVRTDCGDGNFSPWTTLTFTTLVEPCIAPTGLSADNTTATTSDLSWDAQGTSSFEYVVDEISEDPSAAGTATTETTFNATDLTAETIYYLHVRTDCGDGNFSPWTTLTFTTEEEVIAPCIAPSGVSALNIGPASADITWNTQAGIEGFEYVLDQTAETPVTGITGTPNNAFAAAGLTSSTTYYFHVRTDCGDGNFSPWTTLSFTTTSTVGIDEHEAAAFTAYPNPSNGEVFISGQTQGTVTLTNLKGQWLMSVNLEETIMLDLSGFETGIYFLRYSNGTATSTVKLIRD